MGFLAALQAKAERDAQVKRTTPQVKIYDNAKDYQRDAQKMFAKGWTSEGQMQGGGGRTTVTRVALLGPLALFAKKGKGKVTVTWYPPTAPPNGDTLSV